MPDSVEHARSALGRHVDDLLARPNVVAAGVGYKVAGGRQTERPSVVCSVSRKVPRDALAARDAVPTVLDGVPTDVVETGPIRALQSRTARQRPAPGGVSIGHREVTAGTLGCLVRKDGELFILSNNHVLANSNDAAPGDPILQPGVHDGGRFPEDQIATLWDFVPIQFPGLASDCSVAGAAAAVLNAIAALLGSGTQLRAVRRQGAENRVDAAIARPLADADVTPEILEIGEIRDLGKAELGTPVQKSGRTTGFTQGAIQQVDVTVDVQYGPGRIARFTDQLMAGPMSQGGDSGSAVLDQDDRLVGLLFAGSDNSTIINRIEHVFSALDLTL